MSDRLSHLIDLVSDNLRLLLLLVGGYWIGVQTGHVEPVDLGATIPELPGWWELVAIGAIAAAVLGYIVGGKIYDLLPDPPGVYLVVMNEKRTAMHGIWKLTRDTFAEMEVIDGPLYEWPNTRVPTYEALYYDPGENKAVANWRESVPASETLGKSQVTDAIEMMIELRESYEKEARRGNAIRRRIASILRVLDRQRAMDQNRAIEGHVAPAVDGGPSIDEIINEHLGELAPEHLQNDEADEHAEGGVVEFIDADAEALVDVEPDGGEVIDREQ